MSFSVFLELAVDEFRANSKKESELDNDTGWDGAGHPKTVSRASPMVISFDRFLE